MDWPTALTLIVLALAVLGAVVVVLLLAARVLREAAKMVESSSGTIAHLARLVTADGDVGRAAYLESVVAEATAVTAAAARPPRPAPLVD